MNPVKTAHISWVQNPIAKYVERSIQAMIALKGIRERLAEPPAGAEPTWFVKQQDLASLQHKALADHTAAISAALLICHCTGGFALANEIRTLASVSLEPADGAEQDRAMLAIQAGLQVLPTYLGMIVRGAHDSPSILLSYINEIRAIRQVPLIAADSALPVNLTFRYQCSPLYEQDCDLNERERIFSKSAAQFCIHYSKTMMQSEESEGAWSEMREHMRQLQKVTNDPELGSYWRVGEAIIDVVINDGYYVPPAMSTALRIVMVATQRLPGGEDGARTTLSPAKFSSLLNALSISRRPTMISKEVLSDFDVQQNVEEERITELQQQLAGENVQSVVDVIPEIKARLEAAMIAFGRAVSARLPEGLQIQINAFDTSMRTVANIFGIFNEAELSEVSFELADAIKSLDGPTGFTPEFIQTVKEQILFLDSSMAILRSSPAATHLQIEGVPADVADSLATVTTAELKKVRQLIATHVDSGIGSEKLFAALGALREVASVYDFAGSTTVANVLAAIVTVISAEVNDGLLKESEQLCLAARALVAVEMYINFITSNLHPPAILIDKANDALRELGQDVTDFRIVSHSDLLEKFDQQAADDSQFDPLLSEICDLRSVFETTQNLRDAGRAVVLSDFATACLRLSAAAAIKGEVKFAELCKHASELAQVLRGRQDDPRFDVKVAVGLVVKTSETITRCIDDYCAKGKINLFFIDVVNDVATLIGQHPTVLQPLNIESASASGEAAESEPGSQPSPLLPAELDDELQALFNEEFSEHILVLREFLNSPDGPVSDSACRATHSLRGCSGTAACNAVSEFFGELEGRFYACKAADVHLTQRERSELVDILNRVEIYQHHFPAVHECPELEMWVAFAQGLGANLALSEPVDDDKSSEDSPHELPALPLAPVTVNVDDRIAERSTFPQQNEEQVKEDLDGLGYDPEMYDIYLTDADDVIPELQSNIQAWMSDMGDKEVKVAIRRNMHTLKGAAGIIRADGISSLTHHMESLFDSIVSGAVTADKLCADLTAFVLNELITMTDAVRSRTVCRAPVGLIDFVRDSCELSRVDASAFAALINSPHDAIASSHSSHSSHSSSDDSQTLQADPAPASTSSEETAQNYLPQEALAETNAEIVTQARTGGTRRGNRGARGRAPSERQTAAEGRQPRPTHQPVVTADDLYAVTPEYSDVETQFREVSPLVQGLINRAAESSRDTVRAKRRSVKGSEKIKVELQLLDNSVQLANELKASSYRQNTLHREMQLSVIALREKLALLLMHANKTTVQLRHFHNIGNIGTNANRDESSDDQKLYMERFSHLSYSQNQAVLQIEQALQDAQDIITQTHLLDSAFGFQGEVVSSLQGDLLQSRLVLFDNEKPNLTGALASACQISHKRADLVLVGTETRLDRQLLESIRDALRHVIANAVAHGIESEPERSRLGKPPTGVVTVKATRRAKSLVIEVSDDGRGIDPEQIRAKAVKLGIIKSDDVLTEQETYHLIAEQGFSTSEAVTQLAGRGVGMDIVKSRLAALGGHLHIASVLGKGTTISLELPLTVGSNRALVCRVSEQWFAIPTFNMAQVLAYPTSELNAIKSKPGQANVQFDGRNFDVVHIADLMAMPDLKLKSARSPSHTNLVLIEQAGIRLAIEVESGISMPEIHVTKFEGILNSVKGIIGSSEVHDGTPALVLDVIELARLNLKMTDTGYQPKLYRVRRVRREIRPLVMIVDDASGYQKVLTNHFKEQGWDVVSAQNGQDALDKLQSTNQPSLFVVDFEMPRMDGIQLTEKLRALSQFDNTPIIMLTTRANFRDSAIKAGVNEFLSKPYDAAALNSAVRAACHTTDTVGEV